MVCTSPSQPTRAAPRVPEFEEVLDPPRVQYIAAPVSDRPVEGKDRQFRHGDRPLWERGAETGSVALFSDNLRRYLRGDELIGRVRPALFY